MAPHAAPFFGIGMYRLDQQMFPLDLPANSRDGRCHFTLPNFSWIGDMHLGIRREISPQGIVYCKRERFEADIAAQSRQLRVSETGSAAFT